MVKKCLLLIYLFNYLHHVFNNTDVLKHPDEKTYTYLLSVGDSDLDQLKTPSTIEMEYGAGKKKFIKYNNVIYYHKHI